jgi:hypothetical protein
MQMRNTRHTGVTLLSIVLLVLVHRNDGKSWPKKKTETE